MGGAAGKIKTGQYIDYRKTSDPSFTVNPSNPEKTNMGMLYGQMLANVMQAMGMSPSEYELWSDSSGATQRGYGTPYLATEGWAPPYVAHYQTVDSTYFEHASDPLPFLLA
jgi:hypothetical protein